MLLPSLPRKLTLHPGPLSLRRSAPGADAAVVVLDGEMTFADLWPHFTQPGEGRTLHVPEARRMLRSLLRKGAVPAWRHHANDARVIAQIYDALCELRLAGLSARLLAASEKLTVLAAFLGAYENALQAASLVDEAERQRLAVLRVAVGDMPETLASVERVEVLAGCELLGARLDVLRAFAARGVAVRVHMPWDEERPHAFVWTEALLHALEARGHPGMTVTFAQRRGRGALQPVARALYTGRTAPAAAATPALAPVVVRRAAAGLPHAESVAAQVAAWLAEGVCAKDIAVVAPQAATATAVVRALHGAGVACAHNTQRNLLHSRAARLFFAGLRAGSGAATGAFWAELWETCGTYVRTDAGTWSPARVVRALRRAGLAGERRWQPEAESAIGGALAQALPQACAEAVARGMVRLCAPARQMPQAGTLAEMAPALLHWARVPAADRPDVSGACGAGMADDGAYPAGADPAAWLAAAQTGASDAAALLEQCIGDALHGDVALDDVWTRAELTDHVEALCAERQFTAVLRDPQGVHVLRPEDAVGGRFRRLVFAGAEMESFPRPLPANPFLPEVARAEINRLAGPRLLQYAPMTGRGTLPAMARDVWLWLEVADTISEQWVVTLQESSGDAMAGPSEPVDELCRVAGVAIGALPASGCVADVVPKPWMPRLWAAAPVAMAPWIQRVNATVPARLTRLWQQSADRAQCARVPARVAADMRLWLEQTVHSASKMDTLGMCAFRYVAAALWGLGPDDDVVLGATPQDLGSAAHAALHRVYQGIMRQGGLREARLMPESALGAARAVIEAEAARILHETRVHPALRPALLAETTATALVQLQRDLSDDAPYEPAALEYGFDDRRPEGPDALTLAHPSGTWSVRVRGSIDRVDVTDTDVRVLDYKRTVRPRQPDRHFQLALYAAVAVRDLLPDAKQVQVGWAGLRPAKITRAQDIPDTPDALLTHLRERLFARIDPVAEGNFAPEPDVPGTCDYCDFRRLCRRDARGDVPPGDAASEKEGAP